jgi:transcriptional regulator
LNTENSARICLQGHVATANPLWKSVIQSQDLLVIFLGGNAYITPSWYPSKKTNGKVVPTWNYTSVHVKGNIEFIHEPSWKIKLLDNMTSAQEKDLEKPWSISDAPPEFIEKLLPEIVGFEIVVKEMYGKFKLSQNQSDENKMGVIQGLKGQGHEMVKQMEN